LSDAIAATACPFSLFACYLFAVCLMCALWLQTSFGSPHQLGRTTGATTEGAHTFGALPTKSSDHLTLPCKDLMTSLTILILRVDDEALLLIT